MKSRIAFALVLPFFYLRSCYQRILVQQDWMEYNAIWMALLKHCKSAERLGEMDQKGKKRRSNWSGIIRDTFYKSNFSGNLKREEKV